MTDETTQKNIETKVAPASTGFDGNSREFKKNRRAPRNKRENVRSEFEQKLLEIRRVTRVSSGGRRFTFSVAIVIGDKKGKVGVGIGKAGDTSQAIEKAVKDAKKGMLKLELNPEGTISHDTEAKYSSAVVILKPSVGRGVVAGSALRDVVELVGLKNINGKILSGSKNKLNIARATVAALAKLKAKRAPKVQANTK